MKFVGQIGFMFTKETSPGIHQEYHVEKNRTGDIERKRAQWQPGFSTVDTLGITATVSIVADSYIKENLGSIRYVVWNNSKWEVKSVDPTNYPRLTLELGGLYNG